MGLINSDSDDDRSDGDNNDDNSSEQETKAINVNFGGMMSGGVQLAMEIPADEEFDYEKIHELIDQMAGNLALITQVAKSDDDGGVPAEMEKMID